MNLFAKIPGVKEFYLFFKENIVYFFEKKKWNNLKRKKIIKLNLGVNKKSTNDFVNIDYLNGDIAHNLEKTIPLDRDTVDEIYTSHTLEHFEFKKIIFILKECERILKPGAKLRVCVPNAKLYIDSYSKGKIFDKRKNWYEPGVTNTDSLIDQINYIAYLNVQHKFLFDEENLINIIKKSGFKNVTIRNFDKNIDLQERDYESIYALAIK